MRENKVKKAMSLMISILERLDKKAAYRIHELIKAGKNEKIKKTTVLDALDKLRALKSKDPEAENPNKVIKKKESFGAYCYLASRWRQAEEEIQMEKKRIARAKKSKERNSAPQFSSPDVDRPQKALDELLEKMKWYMDTWPHRRASISNRLLPYPHNGNIEWTGDQILEKLIALEKAGVRLNPSLRDEINQIGGDILRFGIEVHQLFPDEGANVASLDDYTLNELTAKGNQLLGRDLKLIDEVKETIENA